MLMPLAQIQSDRTLVPATLATLVLVFRALISTSVITIHVMLPPLVAVLTPLEVTPVLALLATKIQTLTTPVQISTSACLQAQTLVTLKLPALTLSDPTLVHATLATPITWVLK